MQLFLVGVGILAIMMVWHFMLRRTILDHHRDALFDLRDDLRAKYIRNGWDLGSPTYIRLRSLLNGYLRYTEEYSFWQFNHLETLARKDPTFQAHLIGKFEKTFATDNQELAELIADFRAKALHVMISYMIVSSGPLVILTAVLVPVVATCLAIRTINRGFWNGVFRLFGHVISIQNSVYVVFGESVNAVASRVFQTDLVEKLSYDQSMINFPMAHGAVRHS